MLSYKDKIKQNKTGSIVTPQGFKVAGLHSGVKRKRNDLGVIYCNTVANAAAVYTLNQVQAEPIKVTQESLKKEGKLQAVIVNSGNANACTGKTGYKNALKMKELTANHFNISKDHVAVASTGIIGEQLEMTKIEPSIKKLDVKATDEQANAFAESILTTDTFPKTTCYETYIQGEKVTIGGAAKGSGMIEPNMGTMLAFLTTDAVIQANYLEKALKEAVNRTFNCITVDGDTSTNDMVLIMASEKVNHEPLTPAHEDWNTFVRLLTKVCEDLAKMIARDGEGATKLVTVEVTGAKTEKNARQVAKSVVGSSLVKTAIYGTDANWGRVIAAIGYSGVSVDVEQIDLSFGPIPVLKQSQPVSFKEEEATAYLENDEVTIYINLNDGNQTGRAWGCDLTYDYVKINASYRT